MFANRKVHVGVFLGVGGHSVFVFFEIAVHPKSGMGDDSGYYGSSFYN